MPQLKSSYTELPNRFYERIQPEAFPDPHLVFYNHDLGHDLGFSFQDDLDCTLHLSGQKLFEGSDPIAQAYAGCQFGHFVPSLGDGRAHLLGETRGVEIQLKGSGRTRFSRGGDGRSPLGAVVREFIVSEAMHALGIPTTRALAIVRTGEDLVRYGQGQPGGVLTRIANSFIRVGTFEYFAYRNDQEALLQLVDYTINRHFPEITQKAVSERCLELIRLFALRQRDLVARWYSVGFIHGVMNTDNCSLAGITIDYGPCAFMDEFQLQKVFSSIDRNGRYAYGNQMSILAWNIRRFAETLEPLIADGEEEAKTLVDQVLDKSFSDFSQKIFETFGRKLGFGEWREELMELVRSFLVYLERESLDFTLAFSHLIHLYEGDATHYQETSELKSFLKLWKDLKPDLSLITSENPLLIPRNHQIEQVIQKTNEGHYEPLKDLITAVKNPFHVEESHRYLLDPPPEGGRVYQTFCGT